ncbi:MAG TPA: DNA polymerase III subunit epsilon [Sutterella sp.]|nr:DNA polymerase III subunit epsilon [Sutterella sp.]
MPRIICFDTETTGLSWRRGDRVVEIGAVELDEDFRIIRRFQTYLNPGRPCSPAARAVHGLTDAFLATQPKFIEVAPEFLDFVRGATLVAHNAAFDTGFVNNELCRVRLPGLTACGCEIVDTLRIARRLYPNAHRGLNDLCIRFGVDISGRALHGALLDSELLAGVYRGLLEDQKRIEEATERSVAFGL